MTSLLKILHEAALSSEVVNSLDSEEQLRIVIQYLNIYYLCHTVLFVGDSEGYIKVWDIMTYCLDEEQLALINSDPQFEDTRQKKYETFILMQRDIQEPNKPLRSRRLR